MRNVHVRATLRVMNSRSPPRTPWGWLLGIVLLLATNVTFLVLWITDSHPPEGAVGAIAGAAVSGLVAIVLAVLTSLERQRDAKELERERVRDAQERERTRIEEYLVQSFQYFEGGQQKRSIGISAVEGFSNQVSGLRRVFVPLLANQVIYILTKIPEHPQAEELDSHEKDNVERMIDLLCEFRSAGSFEKHYERLLGAINDKVERMDKKSASGEWSCKLRTWIKELERSAPPDT